MAKKYVCSKCGQTGHNRRSCGKPTLPHRLSPTIAPSSPQTTARTPIGDMFAKVSPHPIPEQEETELSIQNLAVFHHLGGTIDDKVLLRTLRRTPIWDTATIEDTTALLTELDETTLRYLAQNIAADDKDWPSILAQTNTSGWLEEELIENPFLPPKDKDTLRIFGIAQHRHMPFQKETPTHIFGVLAHSSITDVRANVAGSFLTPPHILLELASDPDPQVQQTVARNTTAPVEALQKLAGSPYLWVREEVANNFRTPPSILEELSYDRDASVRARVARNQHTSPYTLGRLAEEDEQRVVQEMMNNFNISAGVAERSAKKNPHLLLGNRGVPPGVLALIAEQIVPGMVDARKSRRQWHPAAFQKILFATNPNLPPETLEGISRSTDEYFRSGIAYNTRTPARILTRLAEDPSLEVRKKLARNTAAPSSVLAALADAGDPVVLREIAQNTRASASLLARLARTSDPETRKLVAIHPRTSAHTLGKLVHDDYDVRNAVAVNPNATAATLAYIYAQPSSHFAYESIAKHENTPADVLDRLAQSSSEDVRLCVLGNPNTTSGTLQRFVDDENWEVAYRSRAKLGLLNFHDYRLFA